MGAQHNCECFISLYHGGQFYFEWRKPTTFHKSMPNLFTRLYRLHLATNSE